MSMRTRLVYGSLIAVWALIVAWQAVEHDRIKTSAREALRNRSRDITTTLGLVIRSQRRFGVVSQERLESALKELVKSGELNSIALLNASGDVVISAGGPIDFRPKGMRHAGGHGFSAHQHGGGGGPQEAGRKGEAPAAAALDERSGIQIVARNQRTPRPGDRDVHRKFPACLRPGPLAALYHRLLCGCLGRGSR